MPTTSSASTSRSSAEGSSSGVWCAATTVRGGSSPDGDHAGDVVRGLDHVDPGVGRDLRRAAIVEEALAHATAGLRQPRQLWQRLDLAAANARMVSGRPRARSRSGPVADRRVVRQRGRLVQSPSRHRDGLPNGRDHPGHAARVASPCGGHRRSRLGLWPGLGPDFGSPTLIPLAIIVGVLAASLLNARSITRLFRALLLDQPPDAIVGDAARAILGALRRANVVSGRLTNEMLTVDPLPDGSVSVAIRDRSAREDSATFARSLDELFSPVVSPRYLIRRDDGRMPSLAFQAVWLPLRILLRRQGGERPVYLRGAPGARRQPRASGCFCRRVASLGRRWSPCPGPVPRRTTGARPRARRSTRQSSCRRHRMLALTLPPHGEVMSPRS